MAKKGKPLCKWNRDIIKAYNTLCGHGRKFNHRDGVSVGVKVGGWTIWCRVGFKWWSQKPQWVSYNFGNVEKEMNKQPGEKITKAMIANALVSEITNARLGSSGDFIVVDDPTYATKNWNCICPITGAFEGMGQNIADFFHDVDPDMEWDKQDTWFNAYKYVLEHKKKRDIIAAPVLGAIALVGIIVGAITPGTCWILFLIGILALPFALFFLFQLLKVRKKIENYEADCEKANS